MKARLTIWITSLTLLLGGCVSEEPFENTYVGNVEALWQMIDEHYCFLTYKKQTLGVDWKEVRGRYLAARLDTMNAYNLFDHCAAMLSELKDGHVNLYSTADVGRNWSWKEDYPKNLDIELRESYLGTKYKIAGGLKYRILERERVDEEGRTVKDSVGYIVYESFSSAVSHSCINEVLYYFIKCKGIILDIRGNGGGKLDNCDILSSHFFEKKTHVGYMSHKTGKGWDDFSSLEPEYITPPDYICWLRPVVVLTNRSCYSAANTFVRNMKHAPNVIVAGDCTGGGGGMPFNAELPCGWGLRFSACPQYDAQGEVVEHGISPDVFCSLDDEKAKEGKDSMIETALTLIE